MTQAAKHVKELYFQCDVLALDSECDFEGKMDGCKIKSLDLQCSGSSAYSNWEANPQRFENLIAGISKWDAFKSSLKTINISGWEMSREKALEVLKKYQLDGIKLEI